MKRYGIPVPYEIRQRWAGQARGKQRSVEAFFRRIILKGLLHEIEEKKRRKMKPHSLATRDILADKFQEIAQRYDRRHWVRKALTVKMDTLVNDIKEIRREEKMRNNPTSNIC